MKIKTIGTIKYGGKYHTPGTALEVKDDEAKRLVALAVAEYLSPEDAGNDSDDDDGELTLEQELEQLKGVGDSMAKAMVEAGITGIEQIQSMTPEELDALPIPGIGKAKAKAIIDDANENFN